MYLCPPPPFPPHPFWKLTINIRMAAAAASWQLAVASMCLMASSVSSSSSSSSCPLDVATCTPEFCKLEDHTMCLRDSPDLVHFGVSDAEIQEILDTHNTLRGQEPATDLFKLVWDPQLAKIAEKWARTCTNSHDANRGRADDDTPIGQNTYWVLARRSTWGEVINDWYREVSHFTYGYGGRDGEVVGHYTQMVSNKAHRIGCGFALCNTDSIPDTRLRFYVCNYDQGQHFEDSKRPYTRREDDIVYDNSVSQPVYAKCEIPVPVYDSDQQAWVLDKRTGNGGLCDCGGKVCKNHGIMDVKTCQCACSSVGLILGEINELYISGDECQHVDCPTGDYHFMCRRELNNVSFFFFGNRPFYFQTKPINTTHKVRSKVRYSSLFILWLSMCIVYA